MKTKHVSIIIPLVCLVVLTIGSTSFAQNASADPTVPTLRPGISVQLPVTKNAVSMPDADKEDALVVAVLRDGEVYSGVHPTTPSAVSENLKGSKDFYLKADTNASYASVEKILDAAHHAGFDTLSVLTSQREAHPGKMAQPKGLEVLLGSSSESGITVVQMINAGGATSTLKIDDKNVSHGSLQSTLSQVLKSKEQKTVILQAANSLPFGDVMNVIDLCRAAGAKVTLSTAGL